MKLYKYLTTPKSFSAVAHQSLEDLSGQTSLQLKHQLKENWQLWVDLINDKGLYNEADDIISKKFNRNIKEISKVQPSNIIIIESYTNKDMECTYNDIVKLLGEHENLTLNAIFWATLCNKGKKTRLKKWINNPTCVESKQNEQ